MALGFGLVACNGDKDESDTGSDAADADTDADTDTDTDADTDTDSDADGDVEPEGGAMRFANLSEPFGPASLYIVGVPASVGTIQPLQGSPVRTVPVGALGIEVTQNGAPSTGTLVTNMTIQQGVIYTVALYGSEASPVLTSSEESVAGLVMPNMRYVFTNAAVDLGPVDLVNLTTTSSIAADLTFGIARVVDIPAGGLSLGVDLDDNGITNLQYDLPVVPAGVLVPTWFTYQGTTLVLAVFSPTGLVLMQPTVLEEPGDTSDTGP